ncbi:SDR family NAD(P)-dependent oxidoreductase, partial [Bradyrhizobium sp. th.b2]|uniref:SDR family NAD(P)-dependent oxidoreductase n=1 Tax=Bradyrhizobium sp. th-b2 TaxID=172088 RepID=UPI003527EED8
MTLASSSSPGRRCTAIDQRNEPTTMGRVNDKVILVTGGARGMGAANARLLVAEGARVVITDILHTE